MGWHRPQRGHPHVESRCCIHVIKQNLRKEKCAQCLAKSLRNMMSQELIPVSHPLVRSRHFKRRFASTKFRTHYILIFACRHEGKESEEHDEPGNHPRKSHDGVTFNKTKNAANSRGGVRPSACSCEAFGSMSGAKWRPDGARPPKFFPYVLCFTFQPRLRAEKQSCQIVGNSLFVIKTDKRIAETT